MKERILRILRKTSLDDSEKLKAIFELLSKEDLKFYGFNKIVELSDEELKKLHDVYWSHAINRFIQNLDTYVYNTGKQYKSHYSTILNWISRDWTVQKIPKTYRCWYGNNHRRWEQCDCT